MNKELKIEKKLYKIINNLTLTKYKNPTMVKFSNKMNNKTF